MHDAPTGPSRTTPARRRSRGFRAAGSLVEAPLRKVSESRGFAVSRLLTQWEAIAGPNLAALSRPLRVGHTRGGLGATLTLACAGAQAPLVQMQLDALKARINACYGYHAIARIVLSQTGSAHGADGLAEAQTPFAADGPRHDPALHIRARAVADGVQDDHLRQALETLAERVFGRTSERKD